MHSNYTLKVFNKLVNSLELETTIINLVSNIYEDLRLDGQLNKNMFFRFIKKWIIRIIYLHDIGKINHKFQKEKMENPLEFQSNHLENFFNEIFVDSKHSKYSKFILDYLLVNDIEKSKFYEKYSRSDSTEEKRVYLNIIYKLFYFGIILNSIVDRHHSILKNLTDLLIERNEDYNGIEEKLGNLFESIFNFKNKYTINNYFRGIPFQEINSMQKNTFSLFFLYKMLYSSLVISDSYATHCFFEDLQPEDISFNIITDVVKEKLMENFFSQKPYDKQFNNLETWNTYLDLKIEDIKSLNPLRSKILVEASESLNKFLNEEGSRIFFLNVPTGGGKTNISLKLIIDILKHPKIKNIKRIHYVFPFINIIEQNYDVICETLTSDINESEDFISKIHSNNDSGLFEKRKTIQEFKEIILNQISLNNPINIISNVNFFNSFIKNYKRANYKFVNLTNSIVILDEIHTLPNENWEYFAKLLTQIAKYLNVVFILMSATLPDLSKFVSEPEIFQNLIMSPQKYQKHPCFLRNKIKFELNEDITSNYFIERINKLLTRQKISHIKVLCVVNTIQNSYDLFEKLNEALKNDFDVFLLNSTILPQRRKLIIDYFNKDNKELTKSILLVSTQSIEAGVDIDCDIGFREYSIFDSIEQISGRVNREGKRQKDDSKIYVFDLNTAKMVYKDDKRLDVQELYKNEIENIIRNKDFNKFYDLVIDFLKNQENDLAKIYNKFVKPTFNLEFEKLSRFDYINTNSINIFSPIKIDLNIYPITLVEKEYLDHHNINTNGFLEGTDIWNLFINIIEGKISNKFLEIKKIQSFLHKFTFSINKRKLISDGGNFNNFETIMGYLKLNKDVLDKLDYRMETGLNPRKLSLVFTKKYS